MATQYNPEEYSQILREFAGYKLVIQGRSPRTVNEYMLDLRTFFRFLIAKGQGNVPDPHSEEFTSIDISGVDVDPPVILLSGRRGACCNVRLTSLLRCGW